MFDALAAFHRAHPGVEVELSEDSSNRIVEQVRTGLADLALIGAAGAPPDDLASLSIVREGLVALVPHDHPLAGRRRLPLAELVKHPLVCLPEGTGIRTVVERACAARDLRPLVALQASAPEAVVDLAERGMGLGVLSASMSVPHEGRLARVPVTGVDVPAVLALVWKRDASNPALDELVRRCREAFGLAEAA